MKQGYPEAEFLEWDAIYSFTNASACGCGLVLDKKTKACPKNPLNDAVMSKIVLAKWLLGMSEFSKEELAILKKLQHYIKGSDRQEEQKNFFERFGTKEQSELIEKLLVEPA
jgi:hypothetical protein